MQFFTQFVWAQTTNATSISGDDTKQLVLAPTEPSAPVDKKKTSWAAEIIRRQNETNKIDKLEFLVSTVPVYLMNNQNRFRPYVEIDIIYPDLSKELFIGKRKLVRMPDQKFRLSFYLTSKINQLALESRPIKKKPKEGEPAQAFDPKAVEDKIENEVIFIQSPDAQEYKQTDPLNILRVALGGSLLTYTQTNYDDYSAWMAWLGLSYQSPVVAYNLGWQADLEGTVFAVKTSKSNVAPQVYHGVLMGYFKFDREMNSDMDYSAFFGLDYLTMQSNGAGFGIKDLISPRFAFSARKIINEKEDWILKFGLSPAKVNLDNVGFDFDISKSWLQDNLRRLEVGLKYQQYRITDAVQTKVRMSMSTIYISYTL